MAVIYLPEDKRAAMIGDALGKGADSYLQTHDTHMRLSALQQAMQGGQDDPYTMSKIVAGNPEAEAALHAIWKQQQSQALTGLYQAHTAQSAAETALLPVKAQLQKAQAAKQMADADLAEKHGRLADAQTNLTKFTAAKDVVEIEKARAQIKQIDDEIKTGQLIRTMTQMQIDAGNEILGQAPGVSNTPYGGRAVGADGATKPPPGALASGEVNMPYSGRAQEPAVATEGIGYPPGTDLNSDPASMAIGRLEKAQAQVAKANAIPPGTSMSTGGKGGRLTMKRPTPLSDRESTAIAADQSMAQTLYELQRSIITDKDGKVHLNPISGRIANLVTAFKKDPQDPDIVTRTLIGHLGITTVGLLPNSRFGAQIMQHIPAILANATSGKAVDLSRIGASARILRNSMTSMAEQVSSKGGVNMEQFKEIDDLTKKVATVDYKHPYKNIDPTTIDPDFTDENLEALSRATGMTRDQILEQADRAKRERRGKE